MADDTRTRILDSAREIVLTEGLEGLSMRRVAEAAGVGTMTTYRHFANKQELVGHVVVEGFKLFQEYFYASLEGRSPADRLLRCAGAYAGFALEHPAYYQLMFASQVDLGELQLDETGQRQVGAALQFLTDRVAECATSGALDTDDPRTTALCLWAQAHGLVSLHLTDRYDEDVEFTALYRKAMGRLLAGWGFRAPGRRTSYASER